MEKFKVQSISVSRLESNTGQIDGLPSNPRFIKDENLRKLVKSIEETPEMLELRGLLVYPYKGKYVIIGGNMRYRACLELGYKELPCVIVPEETSKEVLKQYIIKDNDGYGEWDMAIIEMTEWADYIRDSQSCTIELPSLIPQFEEESPKREKKVLMDYTIFFETVEEMNIFYEFLNKLRNRFAGTASVSRRVLRWVAELYKENGELSDSQLLNKLIRVDMEEDIEPDSTEDYGRFREEGI